MSDMPREGSLMLPKASWVLLAGYGESFVDRAIDCFNRQDYQGELELVIVDNNDEPMPSLEGLADWYPHIQYVHSKRMGVGALRNFGNSHATGEVILNADEDDWYSPNRVRAQVTRLIDSGKQVTGWHNVLYFDTSTGKAYKYFYSPDRPHGPYAIGMSQCYWKSWWEKHPFVSVGIEDRPFSDEAAYAHQLDSCDAEQLHVALIHDRNVCNKKSLVGRHKQFPEVKLSDLPKEFLSAVGVREQ